MVLGMTMTLFFSSRVGDLLTDAVGRPQGAVAADEKEHADIQALQGINDLADVLAAPGGRQDGAAVVVNIRHLVGGEAHEVVAVAGNEALEAVAHPVDVAHIVKVMEFQDNGPDDVIGAGAQTPAGGDGAVHLGGIIKNLGPGADQFEAERLGTGGELHQILPGVVYQDLFGILHKAFFHQLAVSGEQGTVLDGGIHLGLPQFRDGGVEVLEQVGSLVLDPDYLASAHIIRSLCVKLK